MNTAKSLSRNHLLKEAPEVQAVLLKLAHNLCMQEGISPTSSDWAAYFSHFPGDDNQTAIATWFLQRFNGIANQQQRLALV